MVEPAGTIPNEAQFFVVNVPQWRTNAICGTRRLPTIWRSNKGLPILAWRGGLLCLDGKKKKKWVDPYIHAYTDCSKRSIRDHAPAPADIPYNFLISFFNFNLRPAFAFSAYSINLYKNEPCNIRTVAMHEAQIFRFVDTIELIYNSAYDRTNIINNQRVSSSSPTGIVLLVPFASYVVGLPATSKKKKC